MLEERPHEHPVVPAELRSVRGARGVDDAYYLGPTEIPRFEVSTQTVQAGLCAKASRS